MPVGKAEHDRDAKQAERDRTAETLGSLSVPAMPFPLRFRFSREEAHQRGRDLPQELSVVLRFPGVTSTRQQFEASLGRAVDRFESVRDKEFYFAQINLQEGAAWPDFIRLIEQIGPAVQACLQRGDIGQPYADFCVSIVDGMAGECFRMPSLAASAIARWGFDLEFSTYLTSED